MTGVFDGSPITGLVPLDSDPRFVYDNLIKVSAGTGVLDALGILFDTVAFGHVNLGGSDTSAFIVYYTGVPGTPGATHIDFDLRFAVSPVVAAVPEPETYALMLIGAVALRLMGRSSNKAGRSQRLS